MRFKRCCAFIAIFTLMFGMSIFLNGCSAQKGTPLFEYLGQNALEFADAFRSDGALSVTVRYDGEASGEPYTVNDEQTIQAVFSALDNMVVTGGKRSGRSDDYLVYYFEMHDNSSFAVTFQEGRFLTDREDQIEIKGFDALIEALPPQDPDFRF